MGLDFLDPPFPAPPPVDKGYKCKIFISYNLLFKQTYQYQLILFYQISSLPLFRYVLYYEIFFFVGNIVFLNTWIILFSYC